MKIALTYDLQEDYLKQGFSKEDAAEFDKPETVEAIADAITHLGHTVEKIGGLKSLIAALSKNCSYDLVFNIAESAYGLGRESAIPCLLDAYKIPYTFSDPNVLAVCLHKGVTKKLFKYHAIPTADFAVIRSANEAAQIDLPFPLFVKPVAEGTSKGIDNNSLVYSVDELKAASEKLFNKYAQPLLVETFLPGREFTVGIWGTGEEASVIGVLEVSFKHSQNQKIYSHNVKTVNYQEKIYYSILEEKLLADEISTVCLKAWRALDCRDAGRIDVRLDKENRPMLMEINPLAGLHPIDSDLVILCRQKGITYQNLIKRILDSAVKRIK